MAAITAFQVISLVVSGVGLVASLAGQRQAAESRASQQALNEAIAAREQEQFIENARLAKIQAAQQEVVRLEQLRRTLATQRAAAALLNFDPDLSRSFFAISQSTRDIAGRDIDNIRLQGLIGERNFLFQGELSRLGVTGQRTAFDQSESAKSLSNFGSAFSKGAAILKDNKDVFESFGSDDLSALSKVPFNPEI